MRKKFILLLLAACFGLGTTAAYAAEGTGRTGSSGNSLEEAFSQSAILPFDYQGKAFIHGRKAEIGGDYQIVQRNGRVLVPIRLMGYLAEQTADVNHGYWDVVWDAKTPDDVLIRNTAQKRTVRFKVNSTTMLVNDQSVQIGVPPQKIGGRVMLPLRDAATALGKRIDWLDGLIVIGDAALDLKHPQTLAAKDKIKTQLTDRRKRVDYEKMATPLAKHGNDVFYFSTVYRDNGASSEEQLFRQTAGKKASRIQVPGTPVFHSGKTIGNDFYYISTVNNQAFLYAYNLAKLQARKIVSLGTWQPADGWLTDVRDIGGALYVNLHVGDLTMGHDSLYRVKDGKLQEVLSAKDLVGLVKDRETLYYTDFRFMSGPADNLYRVDVATGQESPLGEPGYAYGIVRSVEAGGGVGFMSDSSLYLKDGNLYALGFKDSDLEDHSAVYRISLTERKHTRLIEGASRFWLVGERLYYLDQTSGTLMRAGMDASQPQNVSSRKVSQVHLHKNVFYYAAKNGGGMELYRYDPASGQEKKLATLTPGHQSDVTFEVNDSGIYYVSHGYEPGIYKISFDGSRHRLAKDNVEQAVLTDEGMVYTLTYEEGIYAAK